MFAIFKNQEDIATDPLPLLDEGLEPTIEDEPTNESAARIRAGRYLSSVSLDLRELSLRMQILNGHLLG